MIPVISIRVRWEFYQDIFGALHIRNNYCTLFQVHSKLTPSSFQGHFQVHSKGIPKLFQVHSRCIPIAVQVRFGAHFVHCIDLHHRVSAETLGSSHLLHWQCGSVVVHIPNASSHWQCIPKCSDLPVQQRQQRIPRPLMGVWQAAGQSGPRLLL